MSPVVVPAKIALPSGAWSSIHPPGTEIVPICVSDFASKTKIKFRPGSVKKKPPGCGVVDHERARVCVASGMGGRNIADSAIQIGVENLQSCRCCVGEGPRDPTELDSDNSGCSIACRKCH